MDSVQGPVPAQRPAARELDPAAARRLVPKPASPTTPTALDRLTDLAARLLSTESEPVTVQVSLLSDVQTIAGGSGLPAGSVGSTSPIADSLCTVTVTHGGALAIDAAAEDVRVAQLPPVASGAVGAYLGAPLVGSSGSFVGALCAFCPSPRSWSIEDAALLEELAGAVVAQLELRALSSEYRSSQLRWDVALEAAGIGSFDWDIDSGRRDWDRRMQELFGYRPGEFQPHIDNGFDRIHDEDRAGVQAAVAAAVDSCGDYRAEFRVVLPDRTVRWLAARGRATAGPDGRAHQLVGTAYDTTELRTARDEAARLLETMATGFAAVGFDWQTTYLNGKGAQVVGMAAAEVVGRSVWEVFPGLDSSAFGPHLRQAMDSRQTVEFEAYYEHLKAWFDVRVVPQPAGLGLYFLDVTGRHLDQERVAAGARRLELLATVSAELAAAGHDIEGAVARLGQTLVPTLADWCLVTLVGEGGQLRDVGCWHGDPEMIPVLERFLAARLTDRATTTPTHDALRRGRLVLLPSGVTATALPTLASEQARADLALLAPESAVVVPLTARGNMIGVLSLVRGADREPMSTQELTIAVEVASRAGLALENARLYAAQLSLAEGLQRSLLTTPPEPDHCQIAVRYVPAAEAASVGGDWFDSFLQRDGATVLVIGDVMGHDTVAAAAMGQLRGLLRGIAWHSGAAPAEVLGGLDAAMEGLLVHTTASAVVARLEQNEDERDRGVTRLRWSNAGHPPPLVLHPDGSVTVLAGLEADLLLGIDPHTPRTESALTLDRGATVLLYTDGLVERRGQDLDAGVARLRDRLADQHGLPLEDLCDHLIAELMPADAEDDVALVAVRLHRQDRARPAEAGPTRVPPEVPAEP